MYEIRLGPLTREEITDEKDDDGTKRFIISEIDAMILCLITFFINNEMNLNSVLDDVHSSAGELPDLMSRARARRPVYRRLGEGYQSVRPIRLTHDYRHIRTRKSSK